jgi:hypothetical protein
MAVCDQREFNDMSRTPTRHIGGAPTRVEIEAAGITPNDIDSEWMDQMVKRLFMELQKQLARVEATKPEDSDVKAASVRTANVRTLDVIERTLERLMRMELERVASRQTKTAVRNEQLRIQLEYRINTLLAARGLPNLPGSVEER